MSRFSKIFRYSLLVSIMALLCLPLIQSNFQLFTLKPLKGDITFPEEVKFKLENWWTSGYQEDKEKYLTEMFGFRSSCVRINNQIAYTFFNYAKANGVVIGKEGYLYEKSYIDAYTGKDFIGQDSIDHIVHKLKFLNGILKENNKHLLIVFAPSKASFYPEYIPDQYLKDKGGKRNYEALLAGVKDAGLNLIDFNSWFNDNKTKSNYPLMPKYGIHWSVYGATLASDSMVKKIEALTSMDMPDYSFDVSGYDSLTFEKGIKQDYDISNGMNLLMEVNSPGMCYPVLKTKNLEKNKPSILILSDSFFWGVYTYEFAYCFKESQFWYYNNIIYPEGGKNATTHGLNTGDEILKRDVLMILLTEPSLKFFGWGFLEKAQKDFKARQNSSSPSYSAAMKKWTTYIKSDLKWMKELQRIAKEKHIPVDSLVNAEADWQIKNQ